MYEYYQSLDESYYILLFAETEVIGRIRLALGPEPESSMFIAKYHSAGGGVEITHFGNLGEAYQWLKDRHEDDLMDNFGC